MPSHAEFLAHLDADSHLLAAAAARGLEPEVPCCPGWRVHDLVVHTAKVYAHKAAIVLAGDVDDWPPRPQLPGGMNPLHWFREQARHVYEVLAAVDPAASVKTFGPDKTSAFWFRRMAHETAVHRVDAEQAHGYESEIDPELALDGIGELFEVFVADTARDGVFQIAGTAEEWNARVGLVAGTSDTHATVSIDSSSGDRFVVSGKPDRVYLWLWGRAPIAAMILSGDRETAERFRGACIDRL